MPFEVTILGCASAIPTTKRNPSAQLVNLLGRFFLIDCGEGTQIQLRKNNVKIQKINYICISHLHGDHYLGLIGLLSTMSLLNRAKELIIFAPDGLDDILELHFRLSYSKILFPFRIVNLKDLDLFKLFEGDNFELFSFGLKHKIPCWGFKLTEKKRSRKIIWLNPLKGSPEYEPSTRGMQAALPYIDIFSSAHNLKSLKILASQLTKIQSGLVDRFSS